MGARKLLNSSYFTGSLIGAAILGGLTGSWIIFGLAATALVGFNLLNDEIRL